jgi:hypothetical protein
MPKFINKLNEKLCYLNEKAKLSTAEKKKVEAFFSYALAELALKNVDQYIKRRILKMKLVSRTDISIFCDIVSAFGIEAPKEIKNICIGKYTLLNAIGNFPTKNLECMCCAGYRVWLALIVGVLLGIGVSKIC